VAHDLGNPLSVALARLDLATDGSESEELDRVERSIEQMATLIDDLFDLATAGEDIGTLERLDLAAIVEGCWRRVQTGDAELINETELTVQADKTRLQQLLTNLIQNAVEHGGDAVTVRVGDLTDGFYVEDDGHGVPEPQREKVLEPGHSLGSGGTGFGLSIVREVARAHDWDLTLTESSAGGARFEFTGVETD
jgi:signal transduction histidine kinase